MPRWGVHVGVNVHRGVTLTLTLTLTSPAAWGGPQDQTRPDGNETTKLTYSLADADFNP